MVISNLNHGGATVIAAKRDSKRGTLERMTTLKLSHLGLLMVEPKEVGKIYCGTKFGKAGKICFNKCAVGVSSCNVKAHHPTASKIS